jgi:hypothetical protein
MNVLFAISKPHTHLICQSILAEELEYFLKMGILQMVVKNDAMKSDPPQIYGWRVFALACSGKLAHSCRKILPTILLDWAAHLLMLC